VTVAVTCCLFAGLALAQKQPPESPLDLNSATEKELAQLPGVGPVTAAAIVQFRTNAGPYRRVEELLVVRGISEARLKEIRPYIFVKPPLAKPTPPPKPPPAKPAPPVKPQPQGEK
jgi:competence ComEA-like helix-hairpin-helix protein